MASVSWQPEDVERVARAVQRVESWPQLDAPQTGSGSTSGSFIPVVRVKVTSSTPTSGLYPCNYQSWAPDTQTWSDTPSGTNQWAQGFNGESLVSGTYYFGQISGVQQSDGKDIIQVVVGGGGSGPTIDILRLTATTPDAKSRFTAKVQAVTVGSGTPAATFADGASCYYFDPDLSQLINETSESGGTAGFFMAKLYGTSDGLPLYIRDDFNLLCTDVFASQNYFGVKQIKFDSPGSATNDWTISFSNGVLTVAHHGKSATYSLCDGSDNTYHSFKWENGLLKTRDGV